MDKSKVSYSRACLHFYAKQKGKRTEGVNCRLQVAGCRLQVAGCRCRLQVAGCRLQVAGCRLQVAGCRLQVQVAGCRLPTIKDPEKEVMKRKPLQEKHVLSQDNVGGRKRKLPAELIFNIQLKTQGRTGGRPTMRCIDMLREELSKSKYQRPSSSVLKTGPILVHYLNHHLPFSKKTSISINLQLICV